MAIKYVIFDLDGTLLDTLSDLRTAVNMALADYGMAPRSREEIRVYVGNGVRNLMSLSVAAAITGKTPDRQSAALMASENPQFEEIFAAFRKYYAEHQYDTTAPYEGVVEAASRIKEAGIKTAIVSNKVDSAVKDLNEKFFHIDVALGELGDAPGAPKRKPAPDLVYMAMEQIGANPEETVYIGDSEVDVQTAKNSGLPCISVLWGFRDRDELEENGATVFAATPDEMVKLVLE